MTKYIFFFVLLFTPPLSLAEKNRISTEFQWSYYLKEPRENYQLQKYSSIYVKLDQLHKTNSFKFKMSGLAQVSVDPSKQVYFNVPELYASYVHNFKTLPWLKSLNVSLGREIKAWNYFDEYFELGLWNSLNLWDPLYPTANGLVGSFIDLVFNYWSFHLFVGGVTIPHFSVNIEREEDRIYSTSRWFSGVPRRVETLGRILDIDYWIHTPFITDVIFQESYIASLNIWTEKEKNMWVKFNAGYKPVNQVTLAHNRSSMVRIFSSAEASVHQELFIFPVQQQLFSIEWGLRSNNLSLLLSGGDNKILERTVPAGWALVNKAVGFTYFSSFFKYEFNTKDRLKNELQISYINTWPHKEKGGDKTEPSFPGYKMVQGLGVDWKTKIFSYQNEVAELSVRYWYSLPDQGGLLLTNFTYHISPSLYIRGTMDILGAEVDSFTFLNRFRSNDRIEGRIGYVF